MAVVVSQFKTRGVRNEISRWQVHGKEKKVVALCGIPFHRILRFAGAQKAITRFGRRVIAKEPERDSTRGDNPTTPQFVSCCRRANPSLTSCRPRADTPTFCTASQCQTPALLQLEKGTEICHGLVGR